MLYILHGPDDYSISQELDAIKSSCGDPSVMATNTATLDADVSVAELRLACETI
jgi:DNA polymerase III delta subunit